MRRNQKNGRILKSKQNILKIEQKSMNFLQKENRTQERKAMKQKQWLSVQIKNINMPSAMSEFSNLAQEHQYAFSYIRVQQLGLCSVFWKKKKPLLQHSNSLSFMCCLWLLLHYNNGVNKLQQTLWPVSPKAFFIQFFTEKKCTNL